MKTFPYALKSAVLLLFALAARPALADTGIAYAWINDATAASVSSTFSLNPGGGPVTATHLGTGLYSVTFPNSGIGAGWAAQATAYGVTTNYCNVVNWNSSTVNVQCYSSSGAAADSEFTVLAVSTGNDKSISYAWASAATTSSYTPLSDYSLNPGGAINITRSATGTYMVAFAGLTAGGGTVQVTAYGSNAICYSAGWTGVGTFDANVDCVDPSGNPIDSEFVIDIVPGGAVPTGLAFSLADNDTAATYTPSSTYTYNPTGSAFNVVRLSTGRYVVTFAGLNAAQALGGNVRATSFSSTVRCAVAHWGAPAGSSLEVTVNCNNPAGGAADSQFTVLALPASGYAYAWLEDGATNVPPLYVVNPGGGTVTAAHLATGEYTFAFPNSGIDVGWTAQATAYGDGANYCKISTWSGGSITVLCFTSAGVAADSQLTVSAVSTTNQRNIAFAWANLPGSASYTPSTLYSYNPAGGITANRTAAGTYNVVFNGLSAVGGTVQVTAYGTDNISCYSNGWSGTNFTASVICEDPSGTPSDSKFVIWVIPAGAVPAAIGYAWADQPGTASYTANAEYAYDPDGGIGITRSATGSYILTFTGLNAADVIGGDVRATAYGTTNRCKVDDWETDTADVMVFVNCYDLTGTLADTKYQVLVFAPVLGAPAAITVNAGSPQSATATTAFPTALSALVEDGNTNPLAGVTVTFTAQLSGPSGTFPGPSLTATAVTDASGIATAPTFTANSTAGGPYNVAATVLGVTTPANFALTNTPLTPVTLQTSPTGLLVSIDGGAFVVAPLTVNLVPGSSHTITTESPQAGGAGVQYAWMSWSDSGAMSHAISVPGSAFTFTANFQTQYQLIITASPSAGGAVTPVSGTYYNAGTVVPVAATTSPAYSFNGWTGAVASPSNASTTVTMSAPESVTANFVAFAGVTIQTVPTGLQFSVDAGPLQTAPQTLSLPEGPHIIAVATLQAGSAGTQYQFLSWSDLGSATHSIAVTGTAATYTANFQTQYQLTISASPAPGGTVSPASGAYYNAGTAVPISASANAGFSFSGWSGPVASAPSASTTVTMSAPENIVANFSALTGVTIQTSPTGLQFSVDGGPAQVAPQTLGLSLGSHTITVATTQAGAAGTQYTFMSWSDAGAASHTVVVSSSPSTYTATFQTQYQLSIAASPSAGGTVTPASGAFYNAGMVVPISATANPGFSFNGWTGAVASASSASTTVTMSAPENITANFVPLTGITIQTVPPGLQFSVDGGPPQTAPQTLPLSPTTHTIAVVATQTPSAGVQDVFQSWSDGGAASHIILVTGSPATYTATFQTAYQLTIAASPTVGGVVTPATGAYYNASTVVPITASANSGYTFNGWSGTVASASSASTTVTMSAPETVTANFSSLTGITIQTNPVGLQFSVDGGAAQTAPQVLSLSLGSHTLSVATPQAGAAGTQYVFISWSDAGSATHSINVTGSAATYTANFSVQYLLTAVASPAGGGSVAASPSTGGYYGPGAIVQLTATANSGFVFSNWSGDLSGSTNPQFISMNAPHNVTANFTTVGATCTFVFGPTSASQPATGTSTVEACPNGSGQPNCGVLPETPASFTVTPSAACGAWTATSSNPAILQLTTGASSGNGAGAVGYTLLNNTHTTSQSYSITVASATGSATFSITEAGSGDNEVYRQVYALYEQLLGRDPDAAGFAFWTGSGGTALGQMADSFLTSPEAFNIDFVAMAVYQAATGAPPTFAQYNAAVSALRAGTQTVPGLFNSLTGTGYTATTLYQNLLNRAPTAQEITNANGAGLANWFAALIGYQATNTPVETPNNEFQSTGTFHTTLAADHSNGLYVRMLYYVILGRDPDAAGLSFWTGIANQGGPGVLFEGNLGAGTRLQILGPGTPNQGFIGSPEFQGLFAN